MLINPLRTADQINRQGQQCIRSGRLIGLCPAVTEIESGTARRVVIQAMSGNTIPKTMSTTTAPVASKLLFRKRMAKAQT